MAAGHRDPNQPDVLWWELDDDFDPVAAQVTHLPETMSFEPTGQLELIILDSALGRDAHIVTIPMQILEPGYNFFYWPHETGTVTVALEARPASTAAPTGPSCSTNPTI